MATRSYIAMKFDDMTVHEIYCHWDGYISNNGKILNQFYSTYDEAKELFEKHQGMSSLAENPEDIRYYDDMEETVYATELDFINNRGTEEFNYYFNGTEWYVSEFDEPYKLLASVLKRS